jgi:hypothetical protein
MTVPIPAEWGRDTTTLDDDSLRLLAACKGPKDVPWNMAVVR